MKRSESIAKLAEAQAKAQAKIKNAERAALNPGFKRGNDPSKYADLAAVWDACREPLSENGLAVFQTPSVGRDEKGSNIVTVTTLLAHSSGEWLESELSAVSEAGPQRIGSTITYLRRYSLGAIVGVAPEDDDGEAGAGKNTEAGRPEQAQTNGNGGAKPQSRTEAVKEAVKAQTKGKLDERKRAVQTRMATLGFEPPAIGEWVVKVLGRAKAETGDDLDKLEAAVADLEQGREKLSAVAVN